ncbi:hypothetical protein K491DRAFT_722230 [Lophiostoma macrostomum CBS 122681]|uniref:Uncharacterized protein n=1 Tax=Lophiostoma macrostomum CBS 122681 TaxID=1314788 RepID=A0A6A6SR32_9PLEO|nr:hypothetical protein K491DRAFT_722230 [Lophiostoma macrostomum CBS 122681]
MPYLVHPPGAHSYVLDEEDEHFLHYFTQWNWPYEHRPADDHQIAQAINRDRKTRRPSLYSLWSREMKRRQEMHDKRRTLEASEMYDSMRKLEKEAAGEQSLSKKIASFFSFSKKRSGKGTNGDGYQNGVYVNHLEEYQKKWVEGDRRLQRNRSRLSLQEFRERLESSPGTPSSANTLRRCDGTVRRHNSQGRRLG